MTGLVFDLVMVVGVLLIPSVSVSVPARGAQTNGKLLPVNPQTWSMGLRIPLRVGRHRQMGPIWAGNHRGRPVKPVECPDTRTNQDGEVPVRVRRANEAMDFTLDLIKVCDDEYKAAGLVGTRATTGFGNAGELKSGSADQDGNAGHTRREHGWALDARARLRYRMWTKSCWFLQDATTFMLRLSGHRMWIMTE